MTSYADDMTAYGALSDDRGRSFVLRMRGEGVAEIAEVVSGVETKVSDRTAAEKLVNTRLYVERAQLPEPEADEFYLADLIGLAAVDANGAALGRVCAVHDYGAGASLELEGAKPLIVPFTQACVPRVDIAGGRVTVVPPEAVSPVMAGLDPAIGLPGEQVPDAPDGRLKAGHDVGAGQS